MTEHLKCPREILGTSAPVRLGSHVLPVVSSLCTHLCLIERSFPVKRTDAGAAISKLHPLSPLSLLSFPSLYLGLRVCASSDYMAAHT